MKIRKLRLQSFRNHTDSTLEMEDSGFVVIRGKNFSGKSSIAQGISMAMTATATNLDAQGRGYESKIKRGAQKAIVTVDVRGRDRTVQRIVTLALSSVGKTHASKCLEDESWNTHPFEKKLETIKTALGIAIDTTVFMSMVKSRDEKAQKNLLAQLVLPAHYDFSKDTIADVESVIGQGTVNFNGEPFAVIELAYKKLFAERQDANKKFKEFTIPDALPRPQGVNSESLKSQLTLLREARLQQTGERDSAARRVNGEALKRDRANAKIETLEAVLRSSKETLRSLESNILTNPASFVDVASRKEERDQLRGDQQRLSFSQVSVKAEQERLLELSQLGSTCPTCDQEIDDSKLALLLKAGMDERTLLTEEYEKVTQAIISLGDVDGAIVQLNKHKVALAEKSDLTCKIEEHTKTLQDAKDEADKDVVGLFDSSACDKTISATDRNIETILQQIQPVIAAEERDKEITIKKEQLKRLEDKATKLDILVKVFDKDGIKAKLIAQYIGGFEQKCNEVLRVWNYSCSLSIEPFKFEITDYRNVSTPLIELSGAEELMFYAAFQCAVSRTAGIGFVVIDRVDTLLPDLRPTLYQHLYQMVTDGTLDQVILLVADTSDKVPKLADSSFFVVEEGNIRRLG